MSVRAEEYARGATAIHIAERERIAAGELIRPVAASQSTEHATESTSRVRGVIVDVDPHFLGTEDWYREVAASRPPKDSPWYHVLVDGFAHRTYVAERNLEPDTEGGPIKHEDLGEFFGELKDGRYVSNRRGN